ncbi:hypothetical protein [Actinoplanes sp. NPDC089786]|uniref:hypothetical protein n=1 Tax=Actinoplanes sp. NPDC089786 TaxID=3155185 RepID=UPI0034188836
MAEDLELARDMERVCYALSVTGAYFAGVDQAESARTLEGKIVYSPLRTLVEQSRTIAARVQEHLRNQGKADEMCSPLPDPME